MAQNYTASELFEKLIRRSGCQPDETETMMAALLLNPVFSTTGPQFTVGYALGTALTTSVSSVGVATLTATGSAPSIVLANDTAVTGAVTVTKITGAQGVFRYDASNRLDITVSNVGLVALAANGAGSAFSFNSDITVAAGAHLAWSGRGDISSTAQGELRLNYDGSNRAVFAVSSGGDLTVAPSGGDTTVTGTLAVSGALTAGSFTVPTAAQPNITSLGTLTSLAVSGNYTSTSGNITLTNGNVVATNGLVTGTFRATSGDDYFQIGVSGNLALFGAIVQNVDTYEFRLTNQVLMRLDDAGIAGETSMWLWDESDTATKRVAFGADDSGGTGFKVLRVAN